MSHEPRSIKTEHDVLLALISHIQYHYLKVSETGETNVIVPVDLSDSPSASQYLHALRLCEDPAMNWYLCQEHDELFWIEATDKAEAETKAAICNAVVVREATPTELLNT